MANKFFAIVNGAKSLVSISTGDLSLTTDKKFVTDAHLTILGNTSGTNTGDNAANSLYSGLVTNATHTGDVTGATGLTIAAKAVTLAKMDDMATASLIYRKSAGAGAPEVNSLATLKTDLGLSGTNSGDNVINNALQAAVPWSVSYDSPEAIIYSMCVYNGKLYAGSGNSGIVYVFDGTTWSTSYDSPEPYIFSMCVYNGKLYAGSGNSGIVYVFDGTTWSTSYDSPEAIIYSMCVYNGKLYAGSYSSGIVYVFDGTTWSTSYDSPEVYILSMCVYNGKLYAGSGNSGIVYVFDGTTWSTSYDSPEVYIFSMCVYNGKLYAGSYSSGIVYVFDGTTWSVSYDSSEAIIYSLCVYNGKLYAGSGNSGIVYVFDGTTWSTSYDSPEIYIYSLCVYNGKLYAGSGNSGIVYVFGELCQAIPPDMLSSSSISLGLNPSLSGSSSGTNTGDNAANSSSLPIAGGTMTGGITNSTSVNPLTTLAESWVGPSSTTGVYFKGGNVGIGTTNPTSALYINVADTAPLNNRQLTISGSGAQGITLDTTDALAGASQAYLNYHTASGYALTGLTAVSGRMLTTSVAGEFIFNNRVGPIVFSADSAYTRKDLYIATTGNVGIGTTSPTNILSIGSGAARKFWIESSATDVVGRALTVAGGSTLAGTAVDNVAGGNLILSSGAGTGTAASSISFLTGTTTTTGKTLQTISEKMTILGNGNVGIGTTNPTAKLHLPAGTATASTAPIKLTAGVLNTVAEAGTIEFDGTDFYITY